MRTRNLLLAATVGLAATTAHAANFVVDALANSSSGGTGVAVATLAAGDHFTVSVASTDLWNAGALPRWSNADGLTGNLFATGSDESGQAAGTLIGVDFGTWTQDGFTAPYGTLVGRIGTEYKALGTSFSGSFSTAGTLFLYYWDSNSGDNTEFVTASVSGVPEPATWGLLLTGFGFVGLASRSRRRSVAA